MLRIFGFSAAATLLTMIGGLILGGPSVFLILTILIILEISLSFDNAVVNAKILVRMSPFWQTIFLTIGIAIAVFGMRLVFPLVLVGVTASLGPVEVIQLAIEGGEGPDSYSGRLEEAFPAIAGFGGMFLAMLFLDWIFSERDITWLTWLERPLARLGVVDHFPVIVGASGLVAAATYLAGDRSTTVMISGLLGIITYLAVNGLGNLFESRGFAEAGGTDEEPEGAASGRTGPSETVKATGKAGFFLFLYLEVLDASFSFDGVVGAFAISQDIFIIAAGLGAGAFWIRSVTVYLVRRGTLENYVYLEHGAHWAIGALAVLLFVNISFHVPEIITGLVGVAFILTSFVNSIMRNRRLDRAGQPHEERIHV